MSGYGQTGAWAGRMAYAPTVQAEIGLTVNTARQFGAEGTTGPGRLRTDSLSHADVYTGEHGVVAVLAALANRARRRRRARTAAARPADIEVLHGIVQTWIWTFQDMPSLDAQFDEAKIATGQLREIKDFAATDWAQSWPATRQVPDRNGGELAIPGKPWHFRDAKGEGEAGPCSAGTQVPGRQGARASTTTRSPPTGAAGTSSNRAGG